MLQKTDINQVLVFYLKQHPEAEISEETFLKMPTKRSREILAETLEGLPDEMFEETAHKISNIFSFLEEERLLSLPFLYEHYFINDILTGALSPEDMEGTFRAKENGFLYRAKFNKELTTVDEIRANLTPVVKNLLPILEKYANCPEDSSPESIEQLKIYDVLLKEFASALEFEIELDGITKECDQLRESETLSKETPSLKEYQNINKKLHDSLIKRLRG